ncbi:MAG: hypothetical protein MJA27_11495 [Pseudanabaenales cyanobacterium]|nr:hypothetical protein [Pseudanabaenales cyanobacterium]
MNKESKNDVLVEVWEAKDTLSAKHGHDLAATCRALYAEQERNPGKFVNLGQTERAQQVADQPTTRSASNTSG